MKWFMMIIVVIFIGSCWMVQCVQASHVLHGSILEVFVEQQKLRVDINGQMVILVLDEQVLVYRDSHSVAVESARPIMPGRYQEGLFFLNEKGLVELMLVSYIVVDGSDCAQRRLYHYNIFGELKEVEQLPSIQKEFSHL